MEFSLSFCLPTFKLVKFVTDLADKFETDTIISLELYMWRQPMWLLYQHNGAKLANTHEKELLVG